MSVVRVATSRTLGCRSRFFQTLGTRMLVMRFPRRQSSLHPHSVVWRSKPGANIIMLPAYVQTAIHGCRTLDRKFATSAASEIDKPASTTLHQLGKASQSSFIRRIARQIEIYSELGKFRLSSLVLVTTVVGYLAVPQPGPISLWHLSVTSLGTWMAIWSANSINQVFEAEHDAKMFRTLNRIIPLGHISKPHAFAFGIVSGIIGTAILATQVNSIAAALAFANIILYTSVYTPLKRITPLNTWVGAFVGALPPIIGWVAAGGNALDPGSLILAAILYIWQIPHFLALSWRLKDDYARAGYAMLSTRRLDRVAPLSLWYTLAMLPLSAITSAVGLTTKWFAFDGAAAVMAMAWYAWKFYKDPGSRTADKLFHSSLWFLPLWLALMLLHWRWDKKESTQDGPKNV